MNNSDNSDNSDNIDQLELQEWQEALTSVLKNSGKNRAIHLLNSLNQYAAADLNLSVSETIGSGYENTISAAETKPYPGDLELERRIQGYIRWNAMIMVHNTNMKDSSLGGHISTYSSASTLYEVGFNHFFRGYDNDNLGDLIYFQGHSSPGIYARSFIEGRLSKQQLYNFRREVDGKGLSSYPHPYLMPDYWQFPTVSMGLGPIAAIYSARCLKYLENRSLIKASDRKVWAFLGDGECSEPESIGALNVAANENLNNLIFVINCNLQRLDGPVRGNGKIVQELEKIFLGNGWNVIKVIWGSNWDTLFAKDKNRKLRNRLDELCDGEFQNFKAKGGGYLREVVFSGDAELEAMIDGWSDTDLEKLQRGGNDPIKVYNAYLKATQSSEKPTVILAKTIKGYGLGDDVSSSNIAHNVKKLGDESMRSFRDRHCPLITDQQLENSELVTLPEQSQELEYLHSIRIGLNGYLPINFSTDLEQSVPDFAMHTRVLAGTGDKEASTTMGFVSIISALCKDKSIGSKIVPIVPDEARTFGMEGMFKQVGIYSAVGQKYVPHDAKNMMPYREKKDGQILEEGINEAGSFASWLAAATAYRHSKQAVIPFYIYYSMFGFQRIGDLAWMAGDSGAKGFLIGATSGRTSLNGEGLQHQDGHSHIQAGLIPNCKSYDPTYNYELAVIIHHGIKDMYKDNNSCFYYITTMNDNYRHIAMPRGIEKNVEQGITKGLYLLHPAADEKQALNLFGSGTILKEVEAAAKLLQADFNISSNVWSMTSSNELYRDAIKVKRNNDLNFKQQPKLCYLQQQLADYKAPIVIATDYVRNYSEQLRQFIPNRLITLGTDGFGRSDTRQKLRYFFEVDKYFVAFNAVLALYQQGSIDVSVVEAAQAKYQIDPNKPFSIEA